MTAITVAPADPRDAPAILALQREAYQSEARLYNDWHIPPLSQTLASLQAEFDTALILKATQDAALVGSVRAHQQDGIAHIGRLIVAPALQRQGIGGALLQAIEQAFPAARQFQLFTGSLSTGNIRLYQRHGYAITGEQVLSPRVTLVHLAKARAAAGPMPG